MGIVNCVKVTDPSRLRLPRHASGSSGTSPVHHAAWSPSDVTPLTALPIIARWVSCFLPACSNVLGLSLWERAHGRAPERVACIIDGMLPLSPRGCFVPCFSLRWNMSCQTFDESKNEALWEHAARFLSLEHLNWIFTWIEIISRPLGKKEQI